MGINREELLRLARAGAVSRVHELQAELDSIYRTFPDLKRGGGVQGRKASGDAAAVPRRAPRNAKVWSAAERKAVSERMKKYWAARRTKTGSPSKGANSSKSAGSSKTPGSPKKA